MPDIYQKTSTVRSSARIVDPEAMCRTLERQLAELAVAKERAEAANRTKTAFLSMVSHELRTPLNAILGFSELVCSVCAKDPTVPPALTTYTGHVHEAAVHLTALINRVLDLAKIEAGRMEVAPRELNVSESLHGALWMVSERAAAAGVSLDLTIEPGSESLWADDQMLMEMLLNLLSNAIKYTPSGGRVAVSSAIGDNGGVNLTVADTGCGIPADKLDAVFAPYEQIDNHYRRALPGTGLGLSLVRAMIGLHGGRITVASPPGQGVIITLYFPPSWLSV